MSIILLILVLFFYDQYGLYSFSLGKLTEVFFIACVWSVFISLPWTFLRRVCISCKFYVVGCDIFYPF